MEIIMKLLSFLGKIAGGFAGFFTWFSTILKQTNISYVEIQTADSADTLVANDGSLISIVEIEGVTELIGRDEFESIQAGLQQSMQSVMSQPGHTLQVFFTYNKDVIEKDLEEILEPSLMTTKRIKLDLQDLFDERVEFLSSYCSHEKVYIAIWTTPDMLTSEQTRRSGKSKARDQRKDKVPVFYHTQNLSVAIRELREGHDSFVKMLVNDFNTLNIISSLLEVHDAVHVMREIADPDYTSRDWRPLLPGDRFVMKEPKKEITDISDITWPSLARQLLPRDGYVYDMRTAQLGDKIYATMFIDLFPKDVQDFSRLLSRTLKSDMPWRISFQADSNGLKSQSLRAVLASILSFTSRQNRLISDSVNLLRYIDINSDDTVVKLRVALSTWANEGQLDLLRVRASLLAKSVEGWGSCDVTEISGDPYAGMVSTMLAMTRHNIASAAIAPLSQVLRMLPFFRPASLWEHGAVLLRSPDGKPWPYQPGSSQQTTWIDLFFARPGSGKSVLSNAINLAVCMSSGIPRLPRIAIIDIGPSSSGLISLLKDALPVEQKHLVAYHRLRMTTDHAINPFDTQLGCRKPTPQERSFLVNFLTLLATPVGAEKSYDGVPDMSGLIVDELYKQYMDNGNPHTYTFGVEPIVDGIIDEIGYVADAHTSWWEITDALFISGFQHEALLSQRRAMPVLADVTAVCRLPAIEDLYGKITAPTGEPLLHAFSRMISSAVREYPIISQVTQFDIGDARVVSLDLDEVARSGGDAANRQTAVMYMLARFVTARHYYLTEESVSDMPESYRQYHHTRITEIREDPKRIVFDEFHRTSSSEAVRHQVIQDMREGRKWKVQVALLSQSLSDFDDTMVEFATSVFIMDAGPEQAVRKTAKVFGLSDTAANALRRHVHGPGPEGATFLAQFATKRGVSTQLLTSTLGPIELWALTTTAEDANIRNQLYKRIGPKNARRVLAKRFPNGSATKELEKRYSEFKEESTSLLDDNVKSSVVQGLVEELIQQSIDMS